MERRLSKRRVTPLTKVRVGALAIYKALEVVKSGNLVQGKNVQKLEKFFENKYEGFSAVAVSNGTATLHLALLALKIGPGDEVIVPAFSFVATANVVELVGAKPVFVDVSRESYNIEPDKILSKINNKTKAIIVVDEFGNPFNVSGVLEKLKDLGIPLISDSACAIGSTFDGHPVGYFSNFISFSFHPRKLVTSGEGGVLLVKDSNLTNQIRSLRNHGLSEHDGFLYAGFNYRMTEFQAAMLLPQLTRVPKIIEARRKVVSIYKEQLRDSRVMFQKVDDSAETNYQTLFVTMKENFDFDNFKSYMLKNSVQVSRGAQFIPAELSYSKKYGDPMRNYPNAQYLYAFGVSLPLFESMKKSEVKRVCNLVTVYLKEN